MISIAFSQTAGCDIQFEQCKNIASEYLLSTCQPLTAQNQTWYNDCACLNAINLGYCYGLCSSPAAVQELNGNVNPKITALCKIAGINPDAKPLPPPSWVKPGSNQSSNFIPTATESSLKPTGTFVKSSASFLQWANCGIILSMAAIMVIL